MVAAGIGAGAGAGVGKRKQLRGTLFKYGPKSAQVNGHSSPLPHDLEVVGSFALGF
jgi:hypothetical protein